MNPQMEGQRPVTDGPEIPYGAYRGGQQQYEVPYQQPAREPLDDNLVEAIAQRMVQRINQGASGKIHGQRDSDVLSKEQRTGLSIVSVIMLVPLGIVLGQQGFGGIVALGIVALAIFLINAVANGAHK